MAHLTKRGAFESITSISGAGRDPETYCHLVLVITIMMMLTMGLLIKIILSENNINVVWLFDCLCLMGWETSFTNHFIILNALQLQYVVICNRTVKI